MHAKESVNLLTFASKGSGRRHPDHGPIKADQGKLEYLGHGLRLRLHGSGDQVLVEMRVKIAVRCLRRCRRDLSE